MKKQLLLITIFVLSVISSHSLKAQAPVAAFTFSSPLCSTQTVQIIDQSTNSPTSWSYTVVGLGTYTTQNPVITFPTTGTFYVTLIASNGVGPSFPHTESVTISAPPNVTATAPASICTGDFIALAGNGALTYTWTGGVIDGSAFAPSTSATYTVTGFNALGCWNTATTSVTLKARPSITVTASSSVCAGSAVTLTASGASTYTWSAGPTGSVLTDSPLGNTTYTVYGTSAATSCSNSATKSITITALPNVTVSSGTVCAGNVFTMIPGGASSYVFSNGSNTVSPTANQSYTVTGTSAAGCTATAVSDVTVLARPAVSVNSGTICAGTVFTLNPVGGVSYSINSPGNSATVSPLTSTTYPVYSFGSNGCISATAAIANVSVTAAPAVTVNSGSICAGAVFTINPQGANSYTYITGSPTVSPLTTTSYSIIGSSTLTGCVSPEVVSTVTVNALPSVSVNSGTVCSGQVFTMSPTGAGAVTFSYSNGSNTVIPTGNASYSVTAYSAQGCASPTQAVSNVTVSTSPVISVNSGTVCQGSPFVVIANGAVTYSYSAGSPTVYPNVSSIVLVTGFSNEGCPSVNTASSTVIVNPLPTLTLTSPTGVCLGSIATMSVSGAISYTWISDNSHANTFTASPTSNTVYTVTGTDNNGCVGTKTVLLNVFVLPTLTVNSGAVCPGGTFTMVPTGALTYTFSSGSPIVSPITTSTYGVIGTDANGCISLNPAISTVSIVNTLTVSVSGNTTICEGGSTTLTASGASTYSWTTNALTNTVSLSPTSTTAYTVIGVNGSCSDTLEVSVLVKPAPNLILSSSSPVLCIGQTAVLTVDGASTYSWEGLSTTDPTVAVSPSVATSYTVTGVSAASCSATAVITQSVQDCTGIPDLSNSQTHAFIYPNPNTGKFVVEITDIGSELTVFNSLGSLIYTKTLSSSQTEVDLRNNPKGVYFVYINRSGIPIVHKVIID